MLSKLAENNTLRSLSQILPYCVTESMARRFRSNKASYMPTTRLEARHVANCRLLADRESLLDLMPQHAVVAEIGAAFGDFSEEILQRTCPQRLHLIDLWEGGRYGKGLDRIQGRFSKEIESKQLVIHRGYSTQQIHKFDNGYFDWVYVDTDHSYSTTKDELVLCKDKVKPGGIIAGHDFSKGNIVKPVVYGVIQACHEFCVLHGWEYIYMTVESSGDFSFAIRKIGAAA